MSYTSFRRDEVVLTRDDEDCAYIIGVGVVEEDYQKIVLTESQFKKLCALVSFMEAVVHEIRDEQQDAWKS